MITVLSSRRKDGMDFNFDKVISANDAFCELLVYEIGFGSRVTALSPTRVVTEIGFMGCHDRTEFRADEQEMLPLYQAAAYAVKLCQNSLDEILQQASDKALAVTGGNTRLLTLGANLFIGQSMMERVMYALAGFDEPTAKRWADLKIPGDKLNAHRAKFDALLWVVNKDGTEQEIYDMIAT